MKRWRFRLSVLAVVFAFGAAAAVIARRAPQESPADEEPRRLPPIALEEARPKPIPLVPESDLSHDPLQGSVADDDRDGAEVHAAAVSDDDSSAPPQGEPKLAKIPYTHHGDQPGGMRVTTPRTIIHEDEEMHLGKGASVEDASLATSQTPHPAVSQTGAAGRLDIDPPPSAGPFGISAAPGSDRAPLAPLDDAGADRTTAPTEPAAANTLNRQAEIPPGRGALESTNNGATTLGEIAGNQPAQEIAAEGTGRPGDQKLEGPQSPTLNVEKIAPEEIQVGKPATFTLKVRNSGPVVAQGVEVHDEVPHGTQLVSTTPPANRGPNGELVWSLGTVKPGDEQTLQVELMPTSEGEIGSVATVTFRAEASARVRATKPELALQVTAPAQVMLGDNVPLKIKLTNPGSGAANKIVLTEKVPAGLKHAAGAELEFEVGRLNPGESREIELALTAVQAGPVTNVLLVRAEANLHAEDHTQLEVVAPALKVGMSGPKRRYLERNATYTVSVTNPGTAPAKNIELVTVLPKALKFVQANNSGQYDATTHSVYWSLEELPARQSGEVLLTTLPIEAGEHRLQIKGQATQNLQDQREEVVVIDGLAAVQFDLTDVNDPVEMGGQTTYEIRVTNQGSKAASNVRLVAQVPAEMKVLSAEAPVRYAVEGQQVAFDVLKQLGPKADTTFRIKVQSLQAGDLRFRVQLTSDDIRTPITKEESTRVYADE